MKDLLDKLDAIEENFLNGLKEIREMVEQYAENNVDEMPSDRQ